MTVPEVSSELDFDERRLGALFKARFRPGRDISRLSRIVGGQSNPANFLDWADRRLVLRKQPVGPILKGAHAIDREYRVLTALHPTTVPVPAPILFDAEADPFGAPSCLMQRVVARVFTDTSLRDLPPDER